MFFLEGVELASRPISLTTLRCGCVKVLPGHDITIDHPTRCGPPHIYPEGGARHGATTVAAVAHTHLVG